jgi:hypothetical protein
VGQRLQGLDRPFAAGEGFRTTRGKISSATPDSSPLGAEPEIPVSHRAPALVALLLLFVATAAHAGRPRYADPNGYGSYAVGHTIFETTDPARDDRRLRSEIWYPADPENAEGEPTFYDFQFFNLGLVSDQIRAQSGTCWLPLIVFRTATAAPPGSPRR